MGDVIYNRESLATAKVYGSKAAVDAADAILNDFAKEFSLVRKRGEAVAAHGVKDAAAMAAAVLENRLSFGDDKLSQVVGKAEGQSTDINQFAR